jgi:hypothetical protein
VNRIGCFGREIAERPWRGVLAQWWPRLLPGMYGGSTHPVIRVGHAVRTLLTDDGTEPRLAELAHGLGYWAARYHPVADLASLPGADSAAAALDTVPPITAREGNFPSRLGRVTGQPVWATALTDPHEARHRRVVACGDQGALSLAGWMGQMKGNRTAEVGPADLVEDGGPVTADSTDGEPAGHTKCTKTPGRHDKGPASRAVDW